jgi:hypothetical protein
MTHKHITSVKYYNLYDGYSVVMLRLISVISVVNANIMHVEAMLLSSYILLKGMLR